MFKNSTWLVYLRVGCVANANLENIQREVSSVFLGFATAIECNYGSTSFHTKGWVFSSLGIPIPTKGKMNKKKGKKEKKKQVNKRNHGEKRSE